MLFKKKKKKATQKCIISTQVSPSHSYTVRLICIRQRYYNYYSHKKKDFGHNVNKENPLLRDMLEQDLSGFTADWGITPNTDHHEGCEEILNVLTACSEP